MWSLILFFPCLPVAYIHSDYKGCSNLFAFLTFLLKLKISVVFLMENGCVFAPEFRLWWNLHPHPSSEVHGSPEAWACNKSWISLIHCGSSSCIQHSLHRHLGVRAGSDPYPHTCSACESGLEHSRRLHEDTKAGVPTGCSVPLPGVGGVGLGSCTRSAAHGLNFRKDIS